MFIYVFLPRPEWRLSHFARFVKAPDANSKGALKKAAKKAEKAAKKAALKAATAGSGAPPAPAPTATTTNETTAKNDQKPTAAKAPSKPAFRGNVTTKPLQVVINPNFDLINRPVVAMAVAVWTDTAIDLDLTSNHMVPHCIMGTEGTGAPITGDLAMARYLARRSGDKNGLLASNNNEAAIDTWVDYAQSLKLLPTSQRLTALSLTLEHALQNQTYLVGYAVTLADFAMFAAAGFPTQKDAVGVVLDQMPVKAVAARRWVRMMAVLPALQEATQLCLGVSSQEAVFDEALDPLVSGMSLLEGAVAGRVVTRFPPEPSGYLHIGHAKAVLLNDYYAKRYKGRLIVRFDDTNPSKEKEEYQQSIIEDLAKLGVNPDLVTYTSDYFPVIIQYAKYMINNGLAFMDDTPQEDMKIERGNRVESKHRNQTPQEAMEYFDLMCKGGEEGGKWCLRAKIDMKSDNGTLRDPVLFRQNVTPHHRSGTTYKAYPTYDLACPIVDSLEGVTHALRTTEYDDRNAQYQWIQKALGVRRSRVHTFSRVNFKFTVLSKRKLTWFVDNGDVSGWDDARMPTVRGVVRRGINIQALRDFMYSQGSSKRIVLMDWHVFWSENKKEVDKEAKRFMAVDKSDNIRLTVANVQAESDYAFVKTAYHPKDPSLGTRSLRVSSNVLLETADVDGLEVGESIALMRWCVVKITKINGSEIEGDYLPDGDFKTAKRKLSWVADVANTTPVKIFEFDNLISKEKLEEEDDFKDYLNPSTMAFTDVVGDTGLKNVQENEVLQLERRGYFRVDKAYINDSKPLVLYMIPDGKKKAMSGQMGKLAHR